MNIDKTVLLSILGHSLLIYHYYVNIDKRIEFNIILIGYVFILLNHINELIRKQKVTEIKNLGHIIVSSFFINKIISTGEYVLPDLLAITGNIMITTKYVSIGNVLLLTYFINHATKYTENMIPLIGSSVLSLYYLLRIIS
jgi:hypothetical protein